MVTSIKPANPQDEEAAKKATPAATSATPQPTEEPVQLFQQQQDQISSFSHGLLVDDDEEEVAMLFEMENMHLPREDYLMRLQNGDLDPTHRRDSIHWIAKVIDYYDFGPLSAYLSANYLDRFVSVNQLPANPCVMQLLAVTCLSLAAKVEETRRPPSLYLQACEPKFTFQVTTIKRMDLLVLSTLNWRMVSVTPFSFIDYFLIKINGHKPSRTLISASVQLVGATVGEDLTSPRVHVGASQGITGIRK
ncbi:cyclin-D4-1-like [Papaver somniferum]|uniref:cyclin-D4-1-like n=1 Tax=Papaver somniferum TaxID=3469 RepID=UPI000E701230|nr:cyclin-D4-1-like [Papaver somniferum]